MSPARSALYQAGCTTYPRGRCATAIRTGQPRHASRAKPTRSAVRCTTSAPSVWRSTALTRHQPRPARANVTGASSRRPPSRTPRRHGRGDGRARVPLLWRMSENAIDAPASPRKKQPSGRRRYGHDESDRVSTRSRSDDRLPISFLLGSKAARASLTAPTRTSASRRSDEERTPYCAPIMTRLGGPVVIRADEVDGTAQFNPSP